MDTHDNVHVLGRASLFQGSHTSRHSIYKSENIETRLTTSIRRRTTKRDLTSNLLENCVRTDEQIICEKDEEQMLKDRRECALSCEVCKNSFEGGSSSKHTCKRCWRTICEACGKNKRIIVGYKIKPSVPHKVCQNCYDDSVAQEKLRIENKLKWGTDSKIAEEWVTKLKLFENSSIKDAKEQYAHRLNAIIFQFQDALLVKDAMAKKSEAWEMMSQVIVKHNCSFREMLHYVTAATTQQQMLYDMANVVTAFVSKYHSEVGFCEEIMQISLFLLCFCAPATAYAILVYLIEEVIPKALYPNQYLVGGDREIADYLEQIIQKLKEQYLYTTQQVVTVKKFLQKEAPTMLASLMFLSTNFETNYCLFEQLVRSQRKFERLVHGLMAFVHVNLETIDTLGVQSSLLAHEFVIGCSARRFMRAVDGITVKIEPLAEWKLQYLDEKNVLIQLSHGEIDEYRKQLRCELAALRRRNKNIVRFVARARREYDYLFQNAVAQQEQAGDISKNSVDEEPHQQEQNEVLQYVSRERDEQETNIRRLQTLVINLKHYQTCLEDYRSPQLRAHAELAARELQSLMAMLSSENEECSTNKQTQVTAPSITEQLASQKCASSVAQRLSKAHDRLQTVHVVARDQTLEYRQALKIFKEAEHNLQLRYAEFARLVTEKETLDFRIGKTTAELDKLVQQNNRIEQHLSAQKSSTLKDIKSPWELKQQIKGSQNKILELDQELWNLKNESNIQQQLLPYALKRVKQLTAKHTQLCDSIACTESERAALQQAIRAKAEQHRLYVQVQQTDTQSTDAAVQESPLNYIENYSLSSSTNKTDSIFPSNHSFDINRYAEGNFEFSLPNVSIKSDSTIIA